MTIKHIFPAISLALVFASLGCSERDPEPSALVERVTAPTPMLTSTASVTEVEPALPDPEPGFEQKEITTTRPDPEPVLDDAPTFEPEIESIEGLMIRRLLTTSEISGREPVGATSSFDSRDDRIYAFVEVSNEMEWPKKLLVHFIGPNAEVTGGIELEIPASVPRWRTWAYTKHFDQPGLWRVEIRDEEGHLLGALPFQVEPHL